MEDILLSTIRSGKAGGRKKVAVSVAMFKTSPNGGLESTQAGLSILETTVVVCLVTVVLAIAVVNIWPAMSQSSANSGIEMVLGELRRARERAVDERRIYRVTFTAPQTIEVDVGVVGNVATTITGSAPGFIPAQPSLQLPMNFQFVVVPGIPTTPLTTPDGLGTGANAIDFDMVNGGGGTQIYFQPDGRALDAANRVNDGVVYIAQPNNLFSSRAVSLLGSTGRAKGWFLSMTGGVAGWMQ
jgi:hypothetical protein